MKKIALLLFCLVIAGCVATKQDVVPDKKNDGDNSNLVTIDGYDKSSRTTIKNINIWRDYNNRSKGIISIVQHGDRVKLLKRMGDAVFIETDRKQKGWVTYYFIKEIK